jgi:hypothetical protein
MRQIHGAGAEEGAATGKISWPHDNLPGGFEPTFRD